MMLNLQPRDHTDAVVPTFAAAGAVFILLATVMATANAQQPTARMAVVSPGAMQPAAMAPQPIQAPTDAALESVGTGDLLRINVFRNPDLATEARGHGNETLSVLIEQIFVDEWIMLHAPSRFRFSLAHEVGHYWLHDPLYQQSTIQCLADWRQVQDAIGEEAYSWFEWQANSFAGLVLVPGEPLKKAFRDRVVALQHAGIRPEQVHHQPTRQYLIQNLADEFKLSEPTMEIRLEKDGLLAPVTNPHHA